MNITNIMLKLWVLLHLGLLNVSQGSQINEVNKNVTSEFKVIQIKPTKLSRVMEGRDVILSCVSNKPYKLCTFENHRAVKSKCSIEPVIGQKRINFQNCSSLIAAHRVGTKLRTMVARERRVVAQRGLARRRRRKPCSMRRIPRVQLKKV